MPETPACPACGSRQTRPRLTKHALSYRRCRACGALFASSGSPQGVTYDEAYFQALGLAASDPSILAMKAATARQRALALERAGASGPLLEVGSGTGLFLEAASARHPLAVGIDIAAGTLGSALARDVRLLRATPGALPFKDRSFGAIAMYDTLEHLHDPRSALHEIARVLAPGGILHLTTPDTGCLAARLLGTSFPHLNPEHVVLFDRGSLTSILAAAGFADIVLRSVRKPLTAAYVRSRLERYRVPILTPLSAAFCALLPRIAARSFLLPSGEMEALARRAR